MNDIQRMQIPLLRRQGQGYKRIAQSLNLPLNTVKSFCRRNEIQPVDSDVAHCLFCGAQIEQTSGRKEKRFCSDKCRSQWWNAHPERLRRRAVYQYECVYCHQPFTAYGNSHRKFCSHDCYIHSRFGGADDREGSQE